MVIWLGIEPQFQNRLEHATAVNEVLVRLPMVHQKGRDRTRPGGQPQRTAVDEIGEVGKEARSYMVRGN